MPWCSRGSELCCRDQGFRIHQKAGCRRQNPRPRSCSARQPHPTRSSFLSLKFYEYLGNVSPVWKQRERGGDGEVPLSRCTILYRIKARCPAKSQCMTTANGYVRIWWSSGFTRELHGTARYSESTISPSISPQEANTTKTQCQWRVARYCSTNNTSQEHSADMHSQVSMPLMSRNEMFNQ